MGVSLWGGSPLYENGNSWEGNIRIANLSWKVRGEGHCGPGDLPWGGRLRM